MKQFSVRRGKGLRFYWLHSQFMRFTRVSTVYFLIFFLIPVINNCSKGRLDLSRVKRENFEIKTVEQKNDPYFNKVVKDLTPQGPVDEQGIPLWAVKNQGHFYQPVFLSQLILRLISNYLNTGDQAHIARAEKYAGKLLAEADKYDGALFFPYKFNNRLWRRDAQGKKMIVKAPWYSGMAQGQALSSFCRLYLITGKKEYLEIAEKVFKSFSIFESEQAPWVVYIDSRSYLWIEELPWPEPKTNILNGFIFGIYGLYDYYQLTKNQLCKTLFQAAVTTIKDHIHIYRNEGDLSWYSLDQLHKTVPSYHQVHIRQLQTLANMTGDHYFNKMADKFYRDTPPIHRQSPARANRKKQ